MTRCGRGSSDRAEVSRASSDDRGAVWTACERSGPAERGPRARRRRGDWWSDAESAPARRSSGASPSRTRAARAERSALRGGVAARLARSRTRGRGRRRGRRRVRRHRLGADLGARSAAPARRHRPHGRDLPRRGSDPELLLGTDPDVVAGAGRGRPPRSTSESLAEFLGTAQISPPRRFLPRGRRGPRSRHRAQLDGRGAAAADAGTARCTGGDARAGRREALGRRARTIARPRAAVRRRTLVVGRPPPPQRRGRLARAAARGSRAGAARGDALRQGENPELRTARALARARGTPHDARARTRSTTRAARRGGGALVRIRARRRTTSAFADQLADLGPGGVLSEAATATPVQGHGAQPHAAHAARAGACPCSTSIATATPTTTASRTSSARATRWHEVASARLERARPGCVEGEAPASGARSTRRRARTDREGGRLCWTERAADRPRRSFDLHPRAPTCSTCGCACAPPTRSAGSPSSAPCAGGRLEARPRDPQRQKSLRARRRRRRSPAFGVAGRKVRRLVGRAEDVRTARHRRGPWPEQGRRRSGGGARAPVARGGGPRPGVARRASSSPTPGRPISRPGRAPITSSCGACSRSACGSTARRGRR